MIEFLPDPKTVPEKQARWYLAGAIVAVILMVIGGFFLWALVYALWTT